MNLIFSLPGQSAIHVFAPYENQKRTFFVMILLMNSFYSSLLHATPFLKQISDLCRKKKHKFLNIFILPFPGMPGTRRRQHIYVKPEFKSPRKFNSRHFNSKKFRPKNVIHHEFSKDKNVV